MSAISSPGARGTTPHRRRTATPFGTGVPCGRVAGVRLALHWSSAVALLLVSALLAAAELPNAAPHHTALSYWAFGLVGATAFLASLAAHEMAHAVVARGYGMQVSGMTLWMLGGLTELDGEPPSPRADAWIAGSGPLTSLFLAGMYWGLGDLVGSGSLLGATFGWLALINVLLAAFNLVPAAPLDGGRLLRAVLWRTSGDRVRAATTAALAGRVFGLLVIGFGFLVLLSGNLLGIWSLLVGSFLYGGARSEQYAGRLGRLTGLTAADVMIQVPIVAPSWASVRKFVGQLGTGTTPQVAYPVVDLDGRTVGAVTVADLARVSASAAPQVKVGDLSRRRRPVTPVVEQDTPLAEVLLAVHLRGHVAVVVDALQHPVGAVDDVAIDRFLRLQQLAQGAAVDASDEPGGLPSHYSPDPWKPS